MNTLQNSASTPLQIANQHLRNRDWNQALSAYIGLWSSAPHLQMLLAINLGYALNNAIKQGVNSTLWDQATELINPNSAPSRSLNILTGKAAAHEVEVEQNLNSKSAEESTSAPQALAQTPSPLGNALKNVLGIEKIYVVNLKRRPDRYIRTLREVNLHGLMIERIEAVDAKISAEAKKIHQTFCSRPVEERHPSSCHVSNEVMARYKTQLPSAVFGYLLSQKKVLQDALDSGHKRILVLDDDVFFSTNAVDRINAIAPSLPQDFKVLLLGASEYADRNTDRFKAAKFITSDDLYRPLAGETCGSFAMVYDHSVFQELLESVNEADGTFDNVSVGTLYHRYPDKCVAVDPAICIPDVGDSDIRPNERIQANHSQKMRWEFDRYHEYTKRFQITVLANSFASLRHVVSLQHELPSEIFLNIFYLSEDGLRPVITGHVFQPKDSEAVPIEPGSGMSLRDRAIQLRMPSSDIVLSWPAHRMVTEEAVVVIFSKALELRNHKGVWEGILDDVVYCLDAGVHPIKGKHSIIIPAFRSLEEVWPTVRSALLQDAQDFEVIVVNDNPDQLNFCDELKKRIVASTKNELPCYSQENFRVIQHKINRNASSARNTGLIHSSGEFVSFLDDDDLFEPNRLSAIEPTLASAAADIGACYCGYSGNWNGTQDMERFPEGDLGELVLTLQYSTHYMCTNTISFLAQSLKVLGGFNESYPRHQDLELMTRFFTLFKIQALKKFLVQNRPALVSETYVANVQKLCLLKHQFLTDMRKHVVSRGNAFSGQVVQAHEKDIVKRDKRMLPEQIEMVRTFLQTALQNKTRQD